MFAVSGNRSESISWRPYVSCVIRALWRGAQTRIPFLGTWPPFFPLIGPLLVQKAQGDKFLELELVQEASQNFPRFRNSDGDTDVLTIYDMHL